VSSTQPPVEKSVGKGDIVVFEMDTGGSIHGTVVSVRPQHGGTGKISRLSRRWSRWAGSTEDLIAIAQTAQDWVERKSGENPAVEIQVGVAGEGAHEERYYALQVFAEDLRSFASGTGEIGLGDITYVVMQFGPTVNGRMLLGLGFGQGSPSVGIDIEGTDRADLSGVLAEVARVVDRGRRRIPPPNQTVEFLLGGLLGGGYFYAAVNLDAAGFLPDNAVGDIIWLILFLIGFLGAVRGLKMLLHLMLRPLRIAAPGQTGFIENWKPKLAAAAGSIAVGLVPFLVERLFGD
jgi:hypothetical protein